MFAQTPTVYYIPKNIDYIVVSDLFSEDYIGGAELTLAAILSGSPAEIFKCHSSSVTPKLIEDNKDKIWILGNFSRMSQEGLVSLVNNNVKYSVIECDYKYCKYRSSHLHKLTEKCECNCHTQKNGLFIRAFYNRAQHVFFMSKEQMQIYIDKFPQYPANNFHVQSSTFSFETLENLKTLREKRKSNNGLWAILSGGSWIKAQEQTEKYCQAKKIKYGMVGGLKPKEFLEELSGYKGLVFMPAGFDTAPRIVIECKLLGLEVIMNENVQINNDDWFIGSVENCEKYLDTRIEYFWKTINGKKD